MMSNFDKHGIYHSFKDSNHYPKSYGNPTIIVLFVWYPLCWYANYGILRYQSMQLWYSNSTAKHLVLPAPVGPP